jgi:hypothetical protein
MDMAAPIAGAVSALPPADAEAVRGSARQTLSQFTAPGGEIKVPAVAVVVAAVA